MMLNAFIAWPSTNTYECPLSFVTVNSRCTVKHIRNGQSLILDG